MDSKNHTVCVKSILVELVKHIKSPLLLFVIGYALVIVLLSAYGYELAIELRILILSLPIIGIFGYITIEVLKLVSKMNKSGDNIQKDHITKIIKQPKSVPYFSSVYHLLDSRLGIDEIREIAFDLGIDFESLGGEGKSSKIRELINFLYRRKRSDELRKWLIKFRPDIAKDFPNK